ncbi:MAG: DoxX family protein [Patescibacteria group bacterium]
MKLFYFSPAYENWAPTVVRIFFGFLFLMSAYYKIPGTATFSAQVEMSGAVGIPLPFIAVILAFILEIVAGVALIIGWHTRTAAIVLAAFVVLIILFFYRDWTDQANFASFMSGLAEAAGLIYISVYGAQHAAVAKDQPPHHLQRV